MVRLTAGYKETKGMSRQERASQRSELLKAIGGSLLPNSPVILPDGKRAYYSQIGINSDRITLGVYTSGDLSEIPESAFRKIPGEIRISNRLYPVQVSYAPAPGTTDYKKSSDEISKIKDKQRAEREKATITGTI